MIRVYFSDGSVTGLFGNRVAAIPKPRANPTNDTTPTLLPCSNFDHSTFVPRDTGGDDVE